ncbi:MAG: penicillin-binding transpeptidase domain-containing protein [Oscillospiraceae bacterium]
MVSAKDNGGNALPYEYEQYYASHNGDDLVLTLDTNVQYYLEKYVKEMADQFEAANGATGIVMDVKTGGVLGMVSYPNYDLNNYSEVSDARLKAAIEDGSASLADQQLRQCRNKALNDTYKPGSTFKILTLSASAGGGRGGYELHL